MLGQFDFSFPFWQSSRLKPTVTSLIYPHFIFISTIKIQAIAVSLTFRVDPPFVVRVKPCCVKRGAIAQREREREREREFEQCEQRSELTAAHHQHLQTAMLLMTRSALVKRVSRLEWERGKMLANRKPVGDLTCCDERRICNPCQMVSQTDWLSEWVASDEERG